MAKRPYRLIETDGSGIVGEQCGRYLTRDNAWKAADKIIDEIRKFYTSWEIWYVVTGPDGVYEWDRAQRSDSKKMHAPTFAPKHAKQRVIA